ncbi:Polar amino acid transport system permease protein OS=Castellaniella defragrans OX=75697 GN=HNR28_000823 PE=3 SV=1 [Castellaniella defragrans]
MPFSWSFVWEILPQLGQAAAITLAVTVGGYIAALVLGLAFFGLTRAPSAIVRRFGGWIIELVRSTPLLIQAYFIFFILPEYGIVLSALATGVLALGLYHGAYTAEAYRAGLESVPAGQWDAVHSLRFSRYAAYRYVIVPQLLPPITPVLGNTFITMLKDLSILSAVAVPELMFVANDVGSQRFQYTEPITMAALIYLVMSLSFAVILYWVERRMRRA